MREEVCKMTIETDLSDLWWNLMWATIFINIVKQKQKNDNLPPPRKGEKKRVEIVQECMNM